MSTKRSHILKQTCSFQLQVCLSRCDILVQSSVQVQIYQQKYQNNVIDVLLDVFQVNNKDTRITSFEFILVSLLLTFNILNMTF